MIMIIIIITIIVITVIPILITIITTITRIITISTLIITVITTITLLLTIILIIRQNHDQIACAMLPYCCYPASSTSCCLLSYLRMLCEVVSPCHWRSSMHPIRADLCMLSSRALVATISSPQFSPLPLA